MAAAETGSGKTGAFGIPSLQIVYETLRHIAAGTVDTTKVSWKFNDTDRDKDLAIDESGLRVQARLEQKWCGVRAVYGAVKGRHYFEAKVLDDGLGRIGVSTATSGRTLGLDKDSYGFGGTGKKSNGNKFEDYGQAFAKGAVVGVYLNCDDGAIHFSVNGKEFGKAFDIPTTQRGKIALYPACVLKNAEMEFNFGDSPFAYPPTNGFKAIAHAETEDTTLAGTGSIQAGRKPLCLIMEPSRELAQQTYDAIVDYKSDLPPPLVECAVFTGGQPTQQQLNQLRTGVDIVIGTPGRLESLIQSRDLGLENVRFFVLDEADRLLDTENLGLILRLYNRIPREDNNLQVLLFSATLHTPEIKELSEKICKFPTLVDLKGLPTIPPTVEHGIYIIDPTKDDSWRSNKAYITDGIHGKNDPKVTTKEGVSNGIKKLKPLILRKLIDTYKMEQVIVFVRTRLDADHLNKYFQALTVGANKALAKEYSSLVIHSGRGQDERTRNLEAFKNGDVRILICTDVLARGIDIKELPYMINYTMPERATDYVHRIGRVGRANKMGLAISLVGSAKEMVWFHQCKSKGEGCKNTNLVEAGGCALWYDELEIVQAIETLTKAPVPRLGADLKLPNASGATYGVEKDQEIQATQAQHAKFLQPLVGELAQLETKAQHGFWQLRTRWNQ